MPVKCSECGFLAMRVVDTRESLETEQRTRETGHKTGNTENNPICHRGAQRIEKECHDRIQTQHGNNPAAGILAIMQAERECGEFCRWMPGRSPKEHEQMVEAQLLRESLQKREEVDKAWREEQDKKRREYEAGQKEADRKWQQQQKEAEEKRRQEEKEADRKWQQQQKDADRDWQLKQKEDDRRWHIEQEMSRRSYQRKWAFVTVGVGVLGAILGALSRFLKP